MFNQFLDQILKEHPLFGIEKEDQQKGHITGLKIPDWVVEGPVYEVFVRNFSEKGTFKEVQDKIPYFLELGVKTLWLMPIFPIGKEKRKGTIGSPYSIKDYEQIDQSLGTPSDLKQLINAAHKSGLKIILDIVTNHMAVDNVWRKDYPQYFLTDDQGNPKRKIADWSDVVDLDYSNVELRQQMKKIISDWIANFDFDGFRCDVARLVPLDFWEDVYTDLIKLKDDIFLLAEWEGANLHPSAFHASYDWTTHFVLQDIYQGNRVASDLITWVIEKNANYPKNALPLRFTENHDFERTRGKFGRDSFYPFVVFNFILNGLPLIYCGQEFGLENTPQLFENDPIDWTRFEDRIFDFYKKMIALRKHYPALTSSEIVNIWNDNTDKIVSIEKSEKEEKILVILNFTNDQAAFHLKLPDFYHNIERFKDLFSGETVNKSEIEKFNIEPYGYFLLRPEKE